MDKRDFVCQRNIIICPSLFKKLTRQSNVLYLNEAKKDQTSTEKKECSRKTTNLKVFCHCYVWWTFVGPTWLVLANSFFFFSVNLSVVFFNFVWYVTKIGYHTSLIPRNFFLLLNARSIVFGISGNRYIVSLFHCQ